MTPIANLPARLISVLRERLSPEDIQIVADAYGEGTGHKGSLYDHLVERAGMQQVVRVLVLHAVAHRNVMGLVRMVSEHYPALQETLHSLGFEPLALARSYLAALQHETKQGEADEAQLERLRYFIRKTDTSLRIQQDRPLDFTLLTAPETAPQFVFTQIQLDELLANHRCIILSHPERAVTAGALRSLAGRLIKDWQQAPALAPLPIFITLAGWFNPTLDLHQFLQQHIANLGISQFAEGLPDQMRSGRVILLLEGLDALPFLQFSELTGLINDLRVRSIAQLGEERQWRNVRCVLSCQAKNFLFGPNWHEAHVLDPVRDQQPLLSDNPGLTLKTHVDGVFERANAAGQLPGGIAANELQTYLGRLAFNAVYAEGPLRHVRSSLGEGGPVQIALPAAAAWLFHQQELNGLEMEPELKASQEELRLAEQLFHWAVINGFLARDNSGLYFSPEPAIYFPDENVKNYLCLHYCLSHMRDDLQLVGRLQRGYVREVWRLWATYDPELVDKLLLLLRSSDKEMRSNAIWILRWCGEGRAVEPLIALCNDTDAQVRHCAALALRDLRDPRAVESLLSLLRDMDDNVRWSAVVALGEFDDEQVVGSLAQALEDRDNDVRLAAVMALEEMGNAPAATALVGALYDEGSAGFAAKEALVKLGEVAMPALMTNLVRTTNDFAKQHGAMATTEKGNAHTVYYTVEILGKIGDIRPLPVLMWMAEHGDEEDVRYVAAEAVKKIEEQHQLAAPLVAALRSEDSAMRAAAAFALGKLGDRRAVEPLIAALQDEDQRIRWGAACLLGDIGDTIAIAPLIAAQTDSDFRVSESAADSLHKIGKHAILPLIDALKDQNGNVRSQAARILGKLGTKQAIEPLIDVLADQNYQVRLQAVRSLGMLGDRQALDPLLAIANDSHREVRKEVGAAIHKIDPTQAVPVLIAALEDEDRETRLAAARDLIRLGDSRAADSLIVALKDEYDLVREYAGYALSQHGDQRAVEPLIENLQDERPVVTWAAATALGAIGDSRAMEPLIALLRDEVRQQCSIVAEALVKFGERVTPMLLAELKDEGPNASFYSWTYIQEWREKGRWLAQDPSEIKNAHLHYYAAQILGEVADIRALPVLMWMKDNDYNETIYGRERVQDAAAKAIEGICQRYWNITLLAAALEDHDIAKRIGAAFALGMRGDERAVAGLRSALSDTDRRVRWGAARLLGDLGDEHAIAALIRALEDEDMDVRRSATSALVKTGEAAVEPLIAAFREKRKTYNWIVYALSEIGETALSPLIAALRDESSKVRYWVAHALGEIKDKQALPPLMAALQDEDAFVRLSAAAALTKLGKSQAMELLLAALNDEDKDVRCVAAINLAVTGSTLAVEPLLAALRDKDRDVCYWAIVALGDIGDDRALPALKRLAQIDYRPWGYAVLEQEWTTNSSSEESQIEERHRNAAREAIERIKRRHE